MVVECTIYGSQWNKDVQTLTVMHEIDTDEDELSCVISDTHLWDFMKIW